MSTPYMAFSCLVRNALAVFLSLWLCTFLITRAYALHEAYVAEVGRRSDEQWLLDKCLDPEFYANLKQHSNLCTEVSNNARASLFLKALSQVAAEKGIHLCGSASTSCLDIAYSAIYRMGWQAAAVLALLLIAAPNFVLALLQILSASVQQSRRRAGFADEESCSTAVTAAPIFFVQNSKVQESVIDLQEADENHSKLSSSCYRRRWIAAAAQYPSPVARTRKAAYFNQPLDMPLLSSWSNHGNEEDEYT